MYLISFNCNIAIDDSSPMEMSHNHFEEDVDDGSVQNSRYILCVL